MLLFIGRQDCGFVCQAHPPLEGVRHYNYWLWWHPIIIFFPPCAEAYDDWYPMCKPQEQSYSQSISWWWFSSSVFFTNYNFPCFWQYKRATLMGYWCISPSHTIFQHQLRKSLQLSTHPWLWNEIILHQKSLSILISTKMLTIYIY